MGSHHQHQFGPRLGVFPIHQSRFDDYSCARGCGGRQTDSACGSATSPLPLAGTSPASLKRGLPATRELVCRVGLLACGCGGGQRSACNAHPATGMHSALLKAFVKLRLGPPRAPANESSHCVPSRGREGENNTGVGGSAHRFFAVSGNQVTPVTMYRFGSLAS